MSKKLLKLAYASVAVKGLLAAIAPKTSLKLSLTGLRLGMKNASELEPRNWYVTAARATGVGMLAAGGVGLLLTGDEQSAAEETAAEETDDGDVDPIEIEPDDG